ncbi:MAG: DsbE family thiol:disulfide interchange protein [Marinovum sp.]|nr:DsbE family thiol:disulfide interchange protein [Marinovum sp.]
MAKVSPMAIAPLLIFAVLALLFFWGMKGSGSDELRSTLIGSAAPRISQVPLAGYPEVVPEDLRSGEVTLVNFWASWCPPCRAEHPKLMELAGSGLPIIGVNLKDDPDDAAAYLRSSENPFISIAFDPKGRTAIDWGVTAPPETFIIDRTGKVVFRFAGPLIGSDYENRFLPNLKTALTRN